MNSDDTKPIMIIANAFIIRTNTKTHFWGHDHWQRIRPWSGYKACDN